MKSLLLALVILLICTTAMLGQSNINGQIQPTPTTPFGNCNNNQMKLKTPDGTIYTCQSGTWGSIASSGSAGGFTYAGGTSTASGNVSVPSGTLSVTNGVLAAATRTGATGATNVLVTDGDSITSRNQWQSSLALTETFTISNPAVGGATVEDRAYAALTDADPLVKWGAQWNIVVIFAGTNDWFYVESPAQTYAALRAYCDQRHKAGFKVVVVTMLSRGGTNGTLTGDAFKNTYNTLIRSHWREFADALADVAANPLLGGDGAYSNTTYFNSDQIHPTNPAGMVLIAPPISAAVNMITSGYESAKTHLVLGPELVTNGTFASGSNWTAQAGWAISGGVATSVCSSCSSGQLYQTIGITAGSNYAVTVTVTAWTSGIFMIAPAGDPNSANYIVGEVIPGTYTFIMHAGTGSNGLLAFNNIAGSYPGFNGSITNVSARLILSTVPSSGNLCTTGGGLKFMSTSACGTY